MRAQDARLQIERLHLRNARPTKATRAAKEPAGRDGPRGLDWPSAVQCAREVVRALVKDWKARRMTLFVREGFAGGALVAGRLGFGCYGRSPDQPGYLTFARSHRGWLK